MWEKVTILGTNTETCTIILSRIVLGMEILRSVVPCPFAQLSAFLSIQERERLSPPIEGRALEQNTKTMSRLSDSLPLFSVAPSQILSTKKQTKNSYLTLTL